MRGPKVSDSGTSQNRRTRTWALRDIALLRDRRKVLFSFVTSLAEVLLQPDVEADEQIAAAHFFDFELGRTGAPVAPGDGKRGPAEAAHDGLELYLHRDVEMRSDERPAALDHFPAVGFKGVCRVVEFDPEEDF